VPSILLFTKWAAGAGMEAIRRTALRRGGSGLDAGHRAGAGHGARNRAHRCALQGNPGSGRCCWAPEVRSFTLFFPNRAALLGKAFSVPLPQRDGKNVRRSTFSIFGL